MAEVRVRISTGKKFLLDERIQKAFPDDYVLDDEPEAEQPPKKSATAAKPNGGDNEGDPA